jgi:hypothetical protein
MPDTIDEPNRCIVCEADAGRGRTFSEASPIDKAGYSVRIAMICDNCLREPEKARPKMADRITGLRDRADFLERFMSESWPTAHADSN